MPLIVFILPPFLILVFGGIFFIQKRLNTNKWTLGKFALIYWGVLVAIEITMLIGIMIDGAVQYFPPSLFINYIFGTPFFIYFTIQCAISKNQLKEKITFIMYAVSLNYMILPFGLAWM